MLALACQLGLWFEVSVLGHRHNFGQHILHEIVKVCLHSLDCQLGSWFEPIF